jgi:hypothetical protein
MIRQEWKVAGGFILLLVETDEPLPATVYDSLIGETVASIERLAATLAPDPPSVGDPAGAAGDGRAVDSPEGGDGGDGGFDVDGRVAPA